MSITFTEWFWPRVHGASFHDILSIGIVIHNPDGSIKAKLHAGIAPTEDTIKKMDEYVLNMHTESGLLDRLKSGEGFDFMVQSAADMTEACLTFLKNHGCIQYKKDKKADAEVGTIYLGNTVGFDLAFIDAQMPALYQFGSYRSIDVSSIDLLAKLPRFADLQLKKVSKKYAHTAIEDILETTAELNSYTDQLLNLSHSGKEKLAIPVNFFGEDGSVATSFTAKLSLSQVSDIIDHSTQLIRTLEYNDGAFPVDAKVALEELRLALEVAQIL